MTAVQNCCSTAGTAMIRCSKAVCEGVIAVVQKIAQLIARLFNCILGRNSASDYRAAPVSHLAEPRTTGSVSSAPAPVHPPVRQRVPSDLSLHSVEIEVGGRWVLLVNGEPER
jgi:hypothetical protein